MLKAQKIIFFLVSGVIYYLLAYHIPRTNFETNIGLYSVLFGAYLYTSFKLNLRFTEVLIIGVVLRSIFLLATPELSDDFYRFYWDGLMTLNGYSPYEFLPKDMILNQELLDKMNSPEYYSIYPGVNQIIFTLCAWIGQSIKGFLICLHLLVLLAEIVCFIAIHRIHKDIKNLGLFFLNPLMILEFSGNLHFEVFALLGLLGAIYYLNKNELIASTSLGISIATKLMPLIFLPIFFLKSDKKWMWIIFPPIIFALTFLPFHSANAFEHIGTSVQLYFGKFEFNSSLYLVIGAENKWILKLLLISIASLIYWLVWKNQQSTNNGIYLLFIAYLFMSQSIHPWYILGFWGVCKIESIPEHLLWTFLIFLTYVTYKTDPYLQQTWVNLIEYSLVISLLLWKVIRSKFMVRDISL